VEFSCFCRFSRITSLCGNKVREVLIYICSLNVIKPMWACLRMRGPPGLSRYITERISTCWFRLKNSTIPPEIRRTAPGDAVARAESRAEPPCSGRGGCGCTEGQWWHARCSRERTDSTTSVTMGRWSHSGCSCLSDSAAWPLTKATLTNINVSSALTFTATLVRDRLKQTDNDRSGQKGSKEALITTLIWLISRIH